MMTPEEMRNKSLYWKNTSASGDAVVRNDRSARWLITAEICERLDKIVGLLESHEQGIEDEGPSIEHVPISGENYWICKVGPAPECGVPPGGDGPLRNAVELAFCRMFGDSAAYLSSGWGGRLTQEEREFFRATSEPKAEEAK